MPRQEMAFTTYRGPSFFSSNGIPIVAYALVMVLGGAGCSSCGHKSGEKAADPTLPAAQEQPAAEPENELRPPPLPPPNSMAGGRENRDDPRQRRDRGDGGVPAPAAMTFEEKEKIRMQRATVAAEAACREVTSAIEANKKIDLSGIALLKDKAKVIEGAAITLITCRAAGSDSDLPCSALSELGNYCRVKRSLLHEAAQGKGADKTASAVYDMCQQVAPKADCAGIRQSIATANPASCPSGSEEGNSLCAAYAWRDPGHCPDGSGGFAKRCAAEAKWAGLLKAGGLPKLAFEGGENDRVLASAGAARLEACNPAQDSFFRECVRLASPPPSIPAKGKLGTEDKKPPAEAPKK